MKEVEILDEGQVGDRGDGDTSGARERAAIWLHRTDAGRRLLWMDVHPGTLPKECAQCTLFVEADGGGQR
jgi:hypothetical protein